MANSKASPTYVLPPWIKRVVGRGSSEWVVRRADCPAFDAYDLVEIGHVEAAPHYKVVRDAWPFIAVVICVGGLGTIRSGDQKWEVGPGQALLLPPNIPQDWESAPMGWSCTVLHYRPEGLLSQSIGLPRLLSIHAQPLHAMITAFRSEFQSEKDPALLRQMLDIIQTKTIRLFNPAQNAGRLWPLWNSVLQNPEHSWTIESLSQRAHLSGEHLRRICLSETKRSPMAQVTWLRLKAAASRLAVSNDVISDIAHEVGFESERAFRSAFTNNFQCSPSEYRQKNRETFDALNKRFPGPETAQNAASGSSAPAALSTYPGVDPGASPLFVPLKPAANAFFSVGERPWFGDIPLHVSHHGVTLIHGVPFLILNEKQGPCCLMMRSGRISEDYRGKPLPQKVRLPVKRTIRAVYFLHACGWGAEPGPFARYRMIYSDRSSVEQPIVVLAGAHPEEMDGRQANLQDWYFSWDQLERANAKPYDATPPSSPLSASQYLYTLQWINPSPEKKVAALEVVSDAKASATLALLAITCV
jgi:AraC-like DNA-binding protein